MGYWPYNPSVGQKRTRLGNRGTVVGIVLIGIIGVVPVAMYRAHQAALRDLGLALSRGLGLPVTVENAFGSPWPSAVLEGVRVGGASPVMTARRVEIEVNFSRLLRLWSSNRVSGSVVNRIRIGQPTFHLTRQRLQQWLRPMKPPEPTADGERARTAAKKPATEIIIEGGAVALELPEILGRRLLLRSRDIYLGAGGRAGRLLLGKTTLHVGGAPLLDLAAVAVELNPSRGYRFVRLAAVGGTLQFPNVRADVHVFKLSPTRAGGFDLRVRGELGGTPPGKVYLRAQVDQALALRSLRVSLEAADMSSLRGLLMPYGMKAEGTRLSGLLTVGWDGLDHWIGLQLEARKLTLQHRVLAGRPIGPVHGKLEGQLSVRASPGRKVITVHALQLTSGAVKLAFGGEVKLLGKETELDLHMRMPVIPCHQVLGSLPDGFAPKLKGLVLTGKMGVKSALKLKTTDLASTIMELEITPLACRVIHDPPAADANTLRNPVTINTLTANGKPDRWVLGPANEHYRPLEKMSSYVKAGFVASEDNLFWRHDGFDRRMISRALIANLEHGKPIKGASTISQQVVKNVFLSHRRTLSRKFQEAVLTWRMEQCITKKRIMELYLNLVEMGPGLHGVPRAARVYFDKEPRVLNPLEVAHLAMLTPSPRRLSRQHAGPKLDAEWMKRLHWVLRKMRQNHSLTTEAEKWWMSRKLVLHQRD